MAVSENIDDLEKSSDAQIIIKQIEGVKNKLIYILKIVKEKSIEIREV